MEVIQLSSFAQLTYDGTMYEFSRIDTSEPLDWYNINIALSIILEQPAQQKRLKQILLESGGTLPEVDMDWAEGYRSSTAAQIGVGLVQHAFPMLTTLFPHETSSDNFYSSAPVLMNRTIQAFKATNIKDFTVTLFQEYRKDLVKAILQASSIHAVCWAALFARYLPTDWLISLIKDRWFFVDTGNNVTVNLEHWDQLLSMLTRYEARRLMKPNPRENAQVWEILEAARLLSSIPEERRTLPAKRTGSSLHDHFSLLSKNIEPGTPFIIPYEIQKVHGHQVEGLTVEVLTTPQEFIDVGDVLNNCAGSATYAVDALEGKAMLLQFKENMKPTYLTELRSGGAGWRVHQLFGPSNSIVPEPENTIIRNFVEREINGRN